MQLLTAAQVLAADDLPTKDVPCPEWGGSVRLKTLKGNDRDAFDEESSKRRTAGSSLVGVRARLVAACAIDADGKALFSPEQVEALGQKSGKVLDRLFDAARALNRIGQDVEEAEKN